VSQNPETKLDGTTHSDFCILDAWVVGVAHVEKTTEYDAPKTTGIEVKI
jgi:hypothetical protein